MELRKAIRASNAGIKKILSTVRFKRKSVECWIITKKIRTTKLVNMLE